MRKCLRLRVQGLSERGECALECDDPNHTLNATNMLEFNYDI